MTDYFYLDSLKTESMKAFHIGSVSDVIEGSVDFRLKDRRFSAQKFQYGFEVVADFNDTVMREVNTSLRTFLYHNPFEKSMQLSSHAHIVTLDPSCESEIAISGAHAREWLHLF